VAVKLNNTKNGLGFHVKPANKQITPAWDELAVGTMNFIKGEPTSF
jgi:hypothetical protein